MHGLSVREWCLRVCLVSQTRGNIVSPARPIYTKPPVTRTVLLMISTGFFVVALNGP